MLLTRILLLPFFLLIGYGLLCAQQQTTYSRAQIYLDTISPKAIATLGLDLTHGHWQGTTYESDFSQQELERIKAAGFRYEIIIEDVQAFYVQQNEGLSNEIDRSRAYPRSTECFGDQEYRVPEHFRLGSMGGFFTYEEMLEHLDSMGLLYPHLISTKQVAGTTKTIEGRDVYWWRISDFPEQQEAEPEVFYNSVTHAREPGGMAQMIFFMWYLLENYESDPDIRQIVNEAQLYFMPCVNPDGYIYNQTNFPNGGGLWRKNKRDNNGNGSFEEIEDGVDLNRNFGFKWGFSNTGSSALPYANTYRGTAPFSEPETQIMRDFCAAHEFRVALNYHTHGNLLLYPFSHTDTLADPDFRMAADLLTLENNYRSGTPIETVGYSVNGDVNDWMYGDDMTKPLIYAFGPEVGDGGFWPAINRIVPHCVENIWQNLTAARLAMELTEFELTAFEWELSGTMPYRLEHFGFDEAIVSLEAESLTGNINFQPSRQLVPINTEEVIYGGMHYELDPNIRHGDAIRVRLTWTAGGATWADTIQGQYLEEVPLWTDSGQTLQNWSLLSIGSNFQNWGISNETYYSAPSCITDSPFSSYATNVRSIITSIEAIELPADAQQAELVFYARWDLEEDKDYVQVLAAPAGTSDFVPLCGLYTNEGVPAQARAEGESLYDGQKNYWVRERIDLSAYLGQSVQFRFLIQSDGNDDGSQGFFLDDLALHVVNTDETTSVTAIGEEPAGLLSVQPNPVWEEIRLSYELGKQSGKLVVYDLLGREVLIREIAPGNNSQQIQTSNWQEGIYVVMLRMEDGKVMSRKILKR